jgi:hypothetical protein
MHVFDSPGSSSNVLTTAPRVEPAASPGAAVSANSAASSAARLQAGVTLPSPRAISAMSPKPGVLRCKTAAPAALASLLTGCPARLPISQAFCWVASRLTEASRSAVLVTVKLKTAHGIAEFFASKGMKKLNVSISTLTASFSSLNAYQAKGYSPRSSSDFTGSN